MKKKVIYGFNICPCLAGLLIRSAHVTFAAFSAHVVPRESSLAFQIKYALVAYLSPGSSTRARGCSRTDEFSNVWRMSPSGLET